MHFFKPIYTNLYCPWRKMDGYVKLLSFSPRKKKMFAMRALGNSWPSMGLYYFCINQIWKFFKVSILGMVIIYIVTYFKFINIVKFISDRLLWSLSLIGFDRFCYICNCFYIAIYLVILNIMDIFATIIFFNYIKWYFFLLIIKGY